MHGSGYTFGGVVGKLHPSSSISGCKFSSSTGQTYGIGLVIGSGAGNQGCKRID